MSSLTRTLECLRDIVTAPLFNIVIFFGGLLIVLSFCSFDGITNFSLLPIPNWTMFATGCALACGGLGAYICLNITFGKKGRILKRAKIEDGLKLKLGRTVVRLEIGKIQDSSGLSSDIAVVLPVNTTFIDNCIRDKNSATGAYILEFYPDQVSSLPEIMNEQLEKLGYQKAENGTYAPGSTILLPSPYDVPAKVLMSASTLRKEKVGIRAEPSTICECIRSIFEFTADRKIGKFRMPVLGSGHGGLDVNEALFILMIAINYYSRNIFHHVKQVDIIVTENDAEKINDSIQYFTFLEEIGK